MLLPQLRRVRWAVRATLVLGVAASVTANILHALDNPISQAIAAWPPLALLLTVELISRVPVLRKSLAYTRLVATATIAGIAAWVSYWHMAGVAARYGETGASAYLLPLSVDGLIVVASICLVELGGRISALEAERIETAKSARATAEAAAVVAGNAAAAGSAVSAGSGWSATSAMGSGNAAGVTSAGVNRPGLASAGSIGAGTAEAGIPGLIPAPVVPSRGTRRITAAALAEAAAVLEQAAEQDAAGRSPVGTDAAGTAADTDEMPVFTPTVTRHHRGNATTGKSSAGIARAGSTPRGAGPTKKGAPAARTGKGTKARRSPAETVELAARIKAERPGVTETELAAALGISASRWRSVRREAAQSQDLRLAA